MINKIASVVGSILLALLPILIDGIVKAVPDNIKTTWLQSSLLNIKKIVSFQAPVLIVIGIMMTIVTGMVLTKTIIDKTRTVEKNFEIDQTRCRVLAKPEDLGDEMKWQVRVHCKQHGNLLLHKKDSHTYHECTVPGCSVKLPCERFHGIEAEAKSKFYQAIQN